VIESVDSVFKFAVGLSFSPGFFLPTRRGGEEKAVDHGAFTLRKSGIALKSLFFSPSNDAEPLYLLHSVDKFQTELERMQGLRIPKSFSLVHKHTMVVVHLIYTRNKRP
jgi:hypothetical protein